VATLDTTTRAVTWEQAAGASGGEILVDDTSGEVLIDDETGNVLYDG
jgi:50S ribosomal subunit-associated GTPase HflX